MSTNLAQKKGGTNKRFEKNRTRRKCTEPAYSKDYIFQEKFNLGCDSLENQEENKIADFNSRKNSVQAKVTVLVKDLSTSIFSMIGISTSDAVNIFLKKLVKEKCFPFHDLNKNLYDPELRKINNQMVRNELVQAKIPHNIKLESINILDKLGFTVSDAINIFLLRCIDQKGIPFNLQLTNETLSAIEQYKSGEIKIKHKRRSVDTVNHIKSLSTKFDK